MSVTDQDLLTALQFHLLEPVDAGASWPSQLWTVAEVIAALNETQAALQKDLSLLFSRATLLTVPNTVRHALPADWIATERVSWRTPSRATPLSRTDSVAADSALSGWDYLHPLTPPRGYTDGETPTLQIGVFPASSDLGVLDLLYVALPASLSNTGLACTLPDEFTPALLWGTLATLLAKPGRAYDPTRAAYCHDRVQETLAAAQLWREVWR